MSARASVAILAQAFFTSQVSECIFGETGMQQPGEAVAEMARASSCGAIWARMSARSRGVALPCTVARPSYALDPNTMEKWWSMSDNVVLVPVVGAVGFLYIVNKVPK